MKVFDKRPVIILENTVSEQQRVNMNKTLQAYCHSPLPVWDVAANASESGEDTVVACDSPVGILIVNSKH